MINLLTTLLAVFLIVNTYAQSPEKMKYQAVIRDSNGHVITNQAIGMQISILQGDLPGTMVYTETQSLVSNANGVTSTEIGTGIVVLGDFSTIDWANGPYFLQIETDPTGGTNYTVTGTNQLLSVPFAMHAKTADSLNTNVHSLSDADGDTKIQVEENPNEDVIRFDIGGTEQWVMIEQRLENRNLDGSIFIGQNAGLEDDKTNNRNIAIGMAALKSNTDREGLVAIGDSALYNNGFGATEYWHSIYNTAVGAMALYSNTIGNQNTALGFHALTNNTTGTVNTAIGSNSLLKNTTGRINTAIGSNTMYHNTTGNYNTALGQAALRSNDTGSYNTAIGCDALYFNKSDYNTAIGESALRQNTTGTYNTAIGPYALSFNHTGDYNTACGHLALTSNTQSFNTAIGYRALASNTIGVVNTASGYQALASNITGNHNTASGNTALFENTSGQRNTATGSGALNKNKTGNDNTAIGFTALNENLEGDNNTAIGRTALFSNLGNENTAMGRSALYYNTSGNQNTGLGRNALVNVTTGDNNTGIGYDAQVPSATANNQIRVGNTSIFYAGIQVSWSITSDKIWKEQIRTLPYGLDMVMQLKPVDYARKNNEIKTREMGFIAQDVEVLLKQMGYDDQGFLTKADNGNLSLRYNDFIALLTKGMQEQQEIIEQQNIEIKTQNENYEQLLKRIEQLEKLIGE